VSREGLWRALTPQMFRYGVLRRALSLSIERERTVTDEASAVEALGLRPRLVAGGPGNVKITLPGDRALAAAILATTGGAKGENRLRVRRPRA
jgi:2-C-methyl-D-erythritol 4-phosphate cytidylyltransferase